MSNVNLEKGSRVMLLATTRWDVGPTNPLGVVGTIIGKGLGLISVRWDNQKYNDYMGDDSDFVRVQELISNGVLIKNNRVMLIDGIDDCNKLTKQFGVIGTVIDINNCKVLVRWEGGYSNSYCIHENNLVIVARSECYEHQ